MSSPTKLCCKGGVGKTTTAMHPAACAAAKSRNKVTLLDADDEQSALRWASQAGDTLPFQVVKGDRNSIAQQVKQLEAEGRTVIIDTPPNNREILTRAAFLATTAIVPLVPTGLDVDRIVPTLELLRDVEATRGSLDVAILFCRWDARKRLAREAVEALGSYPIVKHKVRDLTRYQEPFGTVPTYLEEYAAVWKEIRQ